MMDVIKSWVFSVSVAAVIATITQMLLPKGNMEKIVRTALSVFLLSAILSPVLLDVDLKLSTDESFKLKVDNYKRELEGQMSEMIENELSQQIEGLISSRLSEMDVSPVSIEVLVTSDTTTSAEIAAVEVKLDEKYKIKDTDIRYLIRSIADCEIKLVYVKG